MDFNDHLLRYLNDKLQWWAIILFVLGVIFGCNPEDYEFKKCKYGPPIDIGTHPVDIVWPSSRMASFSPSQLNKIVLVSTAFDDQEMVYTYDLESKEYELIFGGKVDSRPDWSINDWILINPENDRQIWKVKSNGDSLIQLTFGGNNHNPLWDPAGTKVLYSTTLVKEDENGSTSLVGAAVLMDENGLILDTLADAGSLTTKADWGSTGLIGMGFRGVFVRETLDQKTNYFLTPDFASDGIRGICWIDEDRFVFSCDAGVFISDFSTGNWTMLKEGLDCREYLYPSYDPSSQKILLNRQEKMFQDDRYLWYRKSVLMNIDGSEEKVLLLP